MDSEKIGHYIKVAREKGADDGLIRSNLLKAGWKEEDINWGFSGLDLPPVPKPEITTHVSDSVNQINENYTLWDAFEHLLLFISMYVLAFSIAILLHLYISYYVPEIYGSSRDVGSYSDRGLVTGLLASIIVTFPMFSFFFLRVTKRTLENPLLRRLKFRKFLIYLTLMITFVVMLIQIITTVYSFLMGNISLNFILHLLVTIAVSGVIFIYYLRQVKEDRKVNA